MIHLHTDRRQLLSQWAVARRGRLLSACKQVDDARFMEVGKLKEERKAFSEEWEKHRHHLNQRDVFDRMVELLGIEQYWLEGRPAQQGCTGIFPLACV